MTKINNAKFEKEVYKKFYSLVYSTCIRKLHHKESIDDAVQSTFLLYIKDQDKIKSNLSSWFYWASKNTCTFMNRVASKNETSSSFDEEIVKDEKSQNNICLDKLISSLSKKKREMLLMKYYDNMSNKEIAEKTQSKESSIKKTIERTISLLQSKFKKKDVLVTALLAQLFYVNKASASTLNSSSFILHNSLIQQSIVKGVLKMYLISKLKLGMVLLTAITLSAYGLSQELRVDNQAKNVKEKNIATEINQLVLLEDSARYSYLSNEIPIYNKIANHLNEISETKVYKIIPVNRFYQKRAGNIAKRIPNWHAKYLAILDRKQSFNWKNVTLNQALNEIRNSNPNLLTAYYKVKNALKMNISLNADKLKLGTILNLLLTQCSLTYVLKNESLVVCSKSGVEEELSLEKYNLQVLIDNGTSMRTIMELVRDFINPEIWHKQSSYTIKIKDNQLHIVADSEVHIAIDEMFLRLTRPYQNRIVKNHGIDQISLLIKFSQNEFGKTGKMADKSVYVELNKLTEKFVKPKLVNIKKINFIMPKWKRSLSDKLEKPISFNINSIGFREGLLKIGLMSGITIAFDRSIFAGNKVSFDTPVDFISENSSLSKTLKRILSKYNLDYTLYSSAVFIKDAEKIINNRFLRVYPLSSYIAPSWTLKKLGLGSPSSGDERIRSYQKITSNMIIEFIKLNVFKNIWRRDNGVAIQIIGDQLVVLHTNDAHKQIQELLIKLSKNATRLNFLETK
ncbi:MAG: hypothetical protein COA79_18130 [Planctomycetota bacterium]|nr:MAG: hypothetical protein COA79_18130 [Planctomycetota bacterium]